jgi:hypothetical protein
VTIPLSKRGAIFGGLVAALGVVCLLMSVRRANGGATSGVASSTNEPVRSMPVESDRDVSASPTTPNPNVAATQEPNQRPTKPLPLGLASGQLPTPDFMRSEPRIAASPAVRDGLEARVSRAATLNQRLATRIAQLKTNAKDAAPEQRQRIEQDIAILESQLEARRPLQSSATAQRR